jgi:hypothetical protein
MYSRRLGIGFLGAYLKIWKGGDNRRLENTEKLVS